MNGRDELIEFLKEKCNYEEDELLNMNYDELEKLMNEYLDESDMFPNGRDEDDGDEDFV